jgi:D-3-phosphoglycerate dehydrogenase
MTSILISAPYMLPTIDRFKPIFERFGLELITPDVTERMEEQELLVFAGQFDGAICGDDRYTARVLEKCSPRLKVISKWGTGIDSIDASACQRLGIKLERTPDAFTHPVADSVLGYMLAFARRQPWMSTDVKSGTWKKLPGRALGECTLGVIGVGRIGREVIRRAQCFGMNILGNDIIEIDPAFLVHKWVSMTSLETLLGESDFISINCDLNPTSWHLINPASLAGIHPGAVLINTARGPIVDESALVKVLQSGILAGAALDVFEVEPLPLDSPLRQMDNVLLAPHNANSSPLAWEKVHLNTIRNLLEGLGISPEGISI